MTRVVTGPRCFDQSRVPDVEACHQLPHTSMVFIDCDFYDLTVPVLGFIRGQVGQDKIVVFPDGFRFKGRPPYSEQRACREWLEHNLLFEFIGYWHDGPQAFSFLVSRREPSIVWAV